MFRVPVQPWGPYIRLSYAACAMRAIESWSLCLCTVAAGWLPNADMALSAMAGACFALSKDVTCPMRFKH